MVEVKYDPAEVSTEELLKVWLALHDPTMDARHYRGGQYRSLVFYTNDEQRQAVESTLNAVQNHVRRPIVSQVAEAPKFWRAEEYHQRYYEKNKAGFCSR